VERRKPASIVTGVLSRGAATLLAVLVLVGCGGSTPTAAPNRNHQVFDPVDVMFLQMMVPHHGQGIGVVRLAKHRPVRPEVRLLADAIEATQRHEAGTMAGWLREWGQPASAPADSHAAHGGMPATDQGAIEAVAKLSDPEFERGFLNLLIAHQDDAIQLARRELKDGRNANVRRIARQIERSRSAQIRQMVGFLDRS
jgi:uncharacterized protein (DUF305 family)